MDTHSGEKYLCKRPRSVYQAKKYQLSDQTRKQQGPLKPCPNKNKGSDFESRNKRVKSKHLETGLQVEKLINSDEKIP